MIKYTHLSLTVFQTFEGLTSSSGLNGYFLYFSQQRGSYMSAHALLNLLYKLGKRDKMRGLPGILSLVRNNFNQFYNTGA